MLDPGPSRCGCIRDEFDLDGLRLGAIASVGDALINLPVDVEFDDALEPGVELAGYPVMLYLPWPPLHAHARETGIAEKFPTMVTPDLEGSSAHP